MNILGLVFSLLLLLSYGFYACWEKQTGNARLRGTYLGVQKANRKLLNCFESEMYGQIRRKKTENEPKNAPKTAAAEKNDPSPQSNGECAKINLWPLIQQGREEHAFLYESVAKLLRSFYGVPLFGSKPRFEYQLLDAWLAAAKVRMQKQSQSSLEKIDFGNESTQRVYYKMLKGAERTISTSGYPSLLDYLKIEPRDREKKICLFHAHPDLLSVFFGPKAAPHLFNEIHKEKAPPLTKEGIERICSETLQPLLSPDLFDLFELAGKSHPPELRRTLVAEDPETQVSLRRNVSIGKGNTRYQK